MKNKYLNSIQKISELSDLENDDVSINIQAYNRLDFLRFKSGFTFFNDGYSEEKILETYKAVKRNQAIAEFHVSIKESYVYNNNIEKYISNTPQIFCSFHIGAYTVVPFILAKHCKLIIAINSKTNIAKKDLYYAISNNKGYDICIINVEENNSIISLIKKIKQGYSVLFYMDGNTGVGGFERRDDKLEIIKFMGKNIITRKGIAFLAYKLNLPIIPIYSFRENAKNHIFLDTPIVRNKESNNNSQTFFVHMCTQIIWNSFENFLKKYKNQWEGWLYVFSFIVKKEEKEFYYKKDYKLMISDKVDLFVKDNKYYLYHLHTFSNMIVTKYIFFVIMKMKENNSEFSFENLNQLLNKNTIELLIKHNYLICIK